MATNLDIPSYYLFTNGTNFLAALLYRPTLYKKVDKSFKNLVNTFDLLKTKVKVCIQSNTINPVPTSTSNPINLVPTHPQFQLQTLNSNHNSKRLESSNPKYQVSNSLITQKPSQQRISGGFASLACSLSLSLSVEFGENLISPFLSWRDFLMVFHHGGWSSLTP